MTANDGLLYKLAKKSRFLQNFAISLITAIHPSIEHNVGKALMLKKALFHCELEGIEGEGFEGAQYAAVTRLLRALARRYPIAAVVGHEHIAPGRKGDPGPGFDWAAIDRELGSRPRVATQVLDGHRERPGCER